MENMSTETSPVIATRQPPAVPEGYLSKPEIARRLHKTIRTVNNWMKRGLLPYYKIGRSVEFKWNEVESHLARTCRVDPTNKN